MNNDLCSDCKELSSRKRGLCLRCYTRHRRHGTLPEKSSLPIQKVRSEFPGYSGWHGTSGGYTNHKCRCDYCVVAWNAYHTATIRSLRKEIAQKEGVVLEIANHGTESGYSRGCSCSKCKEAHCLYQKEYQRNVIFRNSTAGQELLGKCKGLCMICEEKSAEVVDHIHGTFLARGYLCYGCNTGLGKLGDTVEGLQKAMRYLFENSGIEIARV